jgi:hypothetical protein
VNLYDFHTFNPIIFTGFQHINNIYKEKHLAVSMKMMPDEERFGRMYMNFKSIFLQRIKSRLYLQPFQCDSGRLAQLVQSICLTSRGSGVRIPHRPQHKSRSRICGIGFVFEGRFKLA